MTSAERVAVVGTGPDRHLDRDGGRPGRGRGPGFDADPDALARAAERSGSARRRRSRSAWRGATLVFVCTPIPALRRPGGPGPAARPGRDRDGRREREDHVVMTGVEAGADPAPAIAFVGGHPMGGSERSGPEHASASVLDGIVWVLSPAPAVPEPR